MAMSEDPPLPLVLRFSDRQVDSRGSTIEQHRRTIEEDGYVWWGWWRAGHKFDSAVNLPLLVRRELDVRATCKIGLWQRNRAEYFIATCTLIAASDGPDMPTPDP